MEELKVENIIIGKQFELCENFGKFQKIVSEQKINVFVVEAEDNINVEENIFFNILWPDSSNVISENFINNNAIVCKFNYKSFSILFTGDIEEEAEKVLISKYEGNDILKSTVLKVAHHGSKSSSIQRFLELVSPKIALIGVGENNKFGHPNLSVIERLDELRC